MRTMRMIAMHTGQAKPVFKLDEWRCMYGCGTVLQVRPLRATPICPSCTGQLKLEEKKTG